MKKTVKNIVIINDFDYTQGGASKVAIDTANLLCNDYRFVAPLLQRKGDSLQMYCNEKAPLSELNGVQFMKEGLFIK